MFVWEWTYSLRSALFSFCDIHIVLPSCVVLTRGPCIFIFNYCAYCPIESFYNIWSVQYRTASYTLSIPFVAHVNGESLYDSFLLIIEILTLSLYISMKHFFFKWVTVCWYEMPCSLHRLTFSEEFTASIYRPSYLKALSQYILV
jgi:hypothetical protein